MSNPVKLQKRPHHGIDPVPEVPDQYHHPQERRKIPIDKVREMMINETLATSFGPRIKCTRCDAWLLQKFIVRIEQPWPQEPTDVCRLCYDKKHDHKAYDRDMRKRR